MNLFRYGAGMVAALALTVAACGPAQDGTQVHVSTTEDTSGTTSVSPSAPETTVVVTPPGPADTVTNTIVEHRTDTVVKVVPGKADTVVRTPPAGSSVSAPERARIDAWLRAHADSLNQYGDPKDTYYTGGTPLFNEATGKTENKYDYIVRQHPDRPWMRPAPVESTPRR